MLLESATRFFAAGQEAPRIEDESTVRGLYRRHRLRVMVAITLGYGLIYMCRLALGVVKQPLIDAGIFSPTDLGLIGSALFYAYAFGKLTNGFLADHANISGSSRSASCSLPCATLRWASQRPFGLPH
jgi:OPA family sugar phosphate sensor protein UhpC-like MFS transporter